MSRRRASGSSRFERDGYRRPVPVTFETFARTWLAEYPDAKGLKRSTREGYRLIIDGHLVPAFGRLQLDTIDTAAVEGYVAAKRRGKVAPRTINRHLNLLNSILKAAVRRRLLMANPVPDVDRPGEPRRRWRILTPPEVQRVEQGFVELIGEATGEERSWREQARAIFVLGAGLRRVELLGLRWREVHLADPDGARLRVAETFVRGATDTPKSEAEGAGDRARTATGGRAVRPSWPHLLQRGRRAGVLLTDERDTVRSRAVRNDAPARWRARGSATTCVRSMTGGTRTSRTRRPRAPARRR